MLVSNWYLEEHNLNNEKWIGKIALTYPSDYGYATSGGSTGRNSCLSYSLSSWGRYSDCYNNDWLYLGQNNHSCQLPASSNRTNIAAIISGTGNSGLFWYVAYSNLNSLNNVLPVTYLKSSIKIISGSGTKEQPFIIVE